MLYAKSPKPTIVHISIPALLSARVLELPENRPIITVWVHGSKLLFSKIFTAFSFLPAGISKGADLQSTYHHAQLFKALSLASPHLFPYDHIYGFGWSGALSFSVRQAAGQMLYEQLKTLIDSYTKMHGAVPFVRVITHSHGGNVALNIAAAMGNECAYVIDELILLACPVQVHTSHLITHPCFKRVISFSSKHDSLQVLDPQGIYKHEKKLAKKSPLFSERLFDHHPKVQQVFVQHRVRGLSHIEFILSSFVGALPTIMAYLNDAQTHTVLSDKPVVYKVILEV